MAFTTVKGSGGAPDSFVGTSGVDAIAFTASRATYFLGAQADNDVVAWVGTATSPITVTDATIRGGDGNDLFTATNTVFASVFINGNAGDDVFEFCPGPASFLGSTLQGGQGDDYIGLNSTSSSLVNGNKGDDTNGLGIVSNSSIFGGQGDDQIHLYDTVTNTLIDGGLGNDYIYAELEADDTGSYASAFTASGNDGNDTMVGGDGGDTLNGDLGNDSISGGNGNDTIIGGQGADTLTGGDGYNTFVLATGDSFAATSGAGAAVTFANGVDWITDFTTGTLAKPIDSVVFNGTELDLAGQARFGLASIVDGVYRIDVPSSNGVYGVIGDYDGDTQVFTDDLTDLIPPIDYSGDILLFSSAATAGTIALASAEVVIINFQQPVT